MYDADTPTADRRPPIAAAEVLDRLARRADAVTARLAEVEAELGRAAADLHRAIAYGGDADVLAAEEARERLLHEAARLSVRASDIGAVVEEVRRQLHERGG